MRQDADTQGTTQGLAVAPFQALPAGSKIGRFTVLGLLGKGGMGVVYAGYDDRLERKVALKVLRGRVDGHGTDEEHLQREARAMARISHPNVVQVHEVGMADGAVYVVMEFIRGVTLAQWLKGEPAWQEVLAVFVAAGRGLQAAHELGIVHRDFKPGNAMRSAGGEVKVLDFGLAGESAPSVTGTRPYMAPEQHEGGPTDARTDQYSFCVSLWAGLSGRLPFGAGPSEALLRAKLQGAPAWPRGGPPTPGRLVDALRRGLAADAAQRWPSMAALLAELKWDPTRRRRRWGLGVAGVAVVGLTGGVAQGWAERRAQRCSGAEDKLAGIWGEDRRAEVEAALRAADPDPAGKVWSQTEGRLSAYAGDWAQMHTEACEAKMAGLEASEAVFDAQMRCLGRARLGLEAAVGTLARADRQTVEKAHLVMRDLRPLGWCEGERALETEWEPPRAREAAAVKEARRALARSASEVAAGRPRVAADAMQEAKKWLAGVEYPPLRVEYALEEGKVYQEQGKFDEAEASHLEALESALVLGPRAEPERFYAASRLFYIVGVLQRRFDEGERYWPIVKGLANDNEYQLATVRHNHAILLSGAGRVAEAEAEYRAILPVMQRSGIPGSSLRTRTALANTFYRQGKYEEAEAELRPLLVETARALGPEHPEIAGLHGSLGGVLLGQGRSIEAEAEFRAAVELRARVFGSQHHLVGQARANLGIALSAQGRYAEAEVEQRASLQIQEQRLGPDHPQLAEARRNLGRVLLAVGRLEEADSELREALRVELAAAGPEHPTVASMHNALGDLREAQGRLSEAETELREAIRIWELALGPDYPGLARARSKLGVVLAARGRVREAEVEQRAALRLAERILRPDHPTVVEVKLRLGRLHLNAGRLPDALRWAEEAWAHVGRAEVEADVAGDAALVLGQVLWAVEGPQRDRARARDLVREALDRYDRGAADSTGRRAEALAWLRSRGSTRRAP